MLDQTIAVLSPHIGIRSETFIRRHMQDLNPGETVVIAQNDRQPKAGFWHVECPRLLIDDLTYGFTQKAQNLLIRNIPCYKKRDPAAPAIQDFLKHHKVGALLSEYLTYSLRFIDISQKLGIPLYAHAHGFDISAALKDSKLQEEYLRYNRIAGVITISQKSRKKLIDLGLSPSKIHVIPCGVDVPDVPIEREIGSEVRCLAVGRMVGKKAPIYLLESFRQAVSQFPNLHLDYIGVGELLSAAHQFIHAFGLEGKVTLHGGQPSNVVQSYMKKADIFIQHSIVDPVSGDEEGLPVAILEAMASALPVVSTYHAGIPEAVLNEKTGLLVEECDCSGMAEHILLLAQNHRLRNQLGHAAWHRAKDYFSWEQEKSDIRNLMQLKSFN